MGGRIGTMEDTSDRVQGTSKNFKRQPLRVSGDQGELGWDTSAMTMLGRIETEHSEGEPVQQEPSASLGTRGVGVPPPFFQHSLPRPLPFYLTFTLSSERYLVSSDQWLVSRVSPVYSAPTPSLRSWPTGLH